MGSKRVTNGSVRHLDTIVEAAAFDQNYVDDTKVNETPREIDTFNQIYNDFELQKIKSRASGIVNIVALNEPFKKK